MASHDEYTHRILTAIDEGRPISQRLLSRELGVALGLTNLLIRRLVKKGFVKVTTIPRNRVRYLLTPAGIAEKTRLTYEFMNYSLRLYSEARRHLRSALQQADAGRRRVAIYGTGEAAEITYLSMREQDMEPIAIFSSDGPGTFLGLPVTPLAEHAQVPFDLLVVATLEPPDAAVRLLCGEGIPREKLLTLRRAAAGGKGNASRA